jgi:hypothetical protein
MSTRFVPQEARRKRSDFEIALATQLQSSSAEQKTFGLDDHYQLTEHEKEVCLYFCFPELNIYAYMYVHMQVMVRCYWDKQQNTLLMSVKICNILTHHSVIIIIIINYNRLDIRKSFELLMSALGSQIENMGKYKTCDKL